MTTKYRELQPLKPPTLELEEIEKRIRKAFLVWLYRPLAEAFYANLELKNSVDGYANAQSTKRSALVTALQSAKVVYSKGAFSGKFNAQISKQLKALGAKWDKKTASWRLSDADLPDELRPVIAASAARFQERLKSIDTRLSQILPAEIAGSVRLEDVFDSSLWKSDRQLRNTIGNLSLLPELSDATRETIAREYAGNLDRSIKDFATEEIASLRQQIQKMVFSGARYDTAVKAIQQSYGVTLNKARFLARQESNLLLAKFAEARYAEAGIDEYKWACVAGSAAHPVRPSHKILEGKIFKFKDPPITTAPGQPQRRCNPGEDFGCRCKAIPVVRFAR